MHLAPAATFVPAPTTRPDAAKALVGVPMGAVMTVTMSAMTKEMAKQQASRAELLAPLLAKLPLDQAHAAMLGAIDGAVAVAPELAERVDALRQSAAGVAQLLREAAADTVAGQPGELASAFSTSMVQVAAPLLEAAVLLDPTMRRPG